jgi:molecular chaperone HtpG
VRELLQNAIDACLERKEIEFQKGNLKYVPSITISINKADDSNSIFTIQDNGKGMTSTEIINYFLNVGTSFRKSMDWKKKFIGDDGKIKITRNGKFGIAVLASFLLGDEIQVFTRSVVSRENCNFKASIDSEFINISTTKSEEQSGTVITIPITNEKRDELLNHKASWNNKVLKWTDWYAYQEPNIKYVINGEELKIDNSINPDKFEKVKWTYKDHSVGHGSPHIACNGIVITSEYKPNVFTYLGDKDIHSSSYVISKKPNILVTDNEGIFPVKLDRNSIDCDIFPFEDDLKHETSKHFIAELLNFKIDKNKFSQKSLLHNIKVMWGKDGFIPQIDYFEKGVKIDYQ